jgi:predicted metalloendopeptidase
MRQGIMTAVAASLILLSSAVAGIDPKDFDLSVKPENDFYHYADGGWIKANPVPAAYSSWGAFHEVQKRNEAALKSILETAAKAPSPSSIQKLVGDFYASGMDEAAIEAAGLKPLAAELARIEALKSLDEVPALVAHFHRMGLTAGFNISSELDPGNSSVVIAGAGQGGLGLPDRDYYLREDEKSKALREQYRAHIAGIFQLAGDKPEIAQARAAIVLKLETALAKGSKTNVELRDPVANYHKLPLADVQKLSPHFDWQRYLAAAAPVTIAEVDIGQPAFFQAFDQLLTSTPLDDWKVYFRWHLLNGTASYLNKAFQEEDFSFYSKTMKGAKELHERWKRVLETVDGAVGEALGQLYVAEYFPPESKARMLALVYNLRSALRARLQTLEWMDDATRAKALVKLDAFNVKIGYPDKWRDYRKLHIDRGAYVLNVLHASEFALEFNLSKIGKPVDRTLWEMTPPTVNAYYDPAMNEIVFPAGILQPPFFDPSADDAVNYGGIGTVIGHEMTHGFDDQGRQYDAHGSLNDWWTPESAKRFTERAARIVKQFSDYVAIDDLHINGDLTQGENIADLGGVKLAYAALQTALKQHPQPEKIDGFTPTQRFFLSWAKVWRTNQRPEQERLQINTDPHSPAQFRVNGPLSNLPEFYGAFGVPEGSPMRRSDADRVEIW